MVVVYVGSFPAPERCYNRHVMIVAIKITSDADPPSNFFLANQKLTLTCNSDGATTFNWTKLEIPSGAQVPLVSSSLLSSGSANSQYIFDPIKATDGGNYTCTDGTSFDTFALNVVAGTLWRAMDGMGRRGS